LIGFLCSLRRARVIPLVRAIFAILFSWMHKIFSLLWNRYVRYVTDNVHVGLVGRSGSTKWNDANIPQNMIVVSAAACCWSVTTLQQNIHMLEQQQG
jgi:hypothetical protein